MKAATSDNKDNYALTSQHYASVKFLDISLLNSLASTDSEFGILVVELSLLKFFVELLSFLNRRIAPRANCVEPVIFMKAELTGKNLTDRNKFW